MKFKIVNAGASGLRVEDKKGRNLGSVPPSMSPRDALQSLEAMGNIKPVPSEIEWVRVWVSEAFLRFPK